MGKASDSDAKVAKANRDFVNRLVEMKAEAGRLKLWRTMHALDEATFQVGYELQTRQGGEAARLAERALDKRARGY